MISSSSAEALLTSCLLLCVGVQAVADAVHHIMTGQAAAEAEAEAAAGAGGDAGVSGE